MANWLNNMSNLSVYEGHARFESPTTVRVVDELLETEKVFINVGARAYIPDIPGLERVDYLTNSSMMDVDFLPEHWIVIGGSYIGLEFGQMFRWFGSRATIVERCDRVIARDDEDVSAAVKEINVPLIGSMNWRFRSLIVFRMIMQGGVYDHDAIPPALVQEMNEVGNRGHHYRALMSLVRHFSEWDDTRSEYGMIHIPVHLIYGDHDWSRPAEREANQRTIPSARMTIVKDAGHFLSLDAPDELVRRILDFSGGGT